ncbi:hypothetical protein OSTOST_23211, partial [Ostertagia ostertagi]
LISEIPLPAYVIVHWTGAVLLIAPLCTSLHTSFNTPYTLDVIVPPDMLALASLMALIAVVVFFSISMVCYISIVIHLLRFNYLKNSSNRQEVRLCIQATGLLLAFLLLFIYHVGQFVINDLGD